MKRLYAILSILVILSVSCSTSSIVPTSGPQKPANAIEISIIYAPESEAYMKDAMDAFNTSYINGINPVSGKPLTADEKPIWITGEFWLVGYSGARHHQFHDRAQQQQRCQTDHF